MCSGLGMVGHHLLLKGGICAAPTRTMAVAWSDSAGLPLRNGAAPWCVDLPFTMILWDKFRDVVKIARGKCRTKPLRAGSFYNVQCSKGLRWVKFLRYRLVYCLKI